MKKIFAVVLSAFALCSCETSYIPTDALGNPSVDKFASTYADTVSIRENGEVKVVNDNTIRACGYSSIDTARQEAYALALDMNSTQDIKGASTVSCVNGAMSNGCLHEYNLSTVMADKKLVGTKKENDCYVFTFKKMNNFKSVKSTDAYSSYSRAYSREGESVVNINIVNAGTSVRAKMNGKEIWIHKNDNFEVVGPKDVTFEIIDQRFEYKKFTIKVPKEPKIITKNISLVQLKRKMKKRVEIGAGFERQDYKTGDTANDERIIVLKNRHQIDPSNSDVVNVHSGVEFTLKYQNYGGGLAIWPSDNFNYHPVCCRTYYIETNQSNVKPVSRKMTMKIVAYDEYFKRIATFKIRYKIFTCDSASRICINYDGNDFFKKEESAMGRGWFAGRNLHNELDSFVMALDGDIISKIDVSFHPGW